MVRAIQLTSAPSENSNMQLLASLGYNRLLSNPRVRKIATVLNMDVNDLARKLFLGDKDVFDSLKELVLKGDLQVERIGGFVKFNEGEGDSILLEGDSLVGW